MARPDYNCGSLMIATEAMLVCTATLFHELFLYNLSTIYIYIYISHTLFNFNDDVSLRFNRRIFHRYSSGVFHSFFLFFFSSSTSSPPFHPRSVRFRDARIELCAAKTNWKYLAPRNIGNDEIYIYICVYIADRATTVYPVVPARY